MTWASGDLRRWLALAAILSLLGTAAVANVLQDADAAKPGASSQRMLLRLHDLPPGYVGRLGSIEEGAFDQCDYLQPADAQPTLAAFIGRFSPKGCFSVYARLYKVPGGQPAPPVIGTGVLDAGSIEAAEAGFAVASEAISHLAENLVLEEAISNETIGEATRLFHWKNAYGLLNPGRISGSFLVWRSGSILGAVFVAGFRLAADDLIAAELAHRQQIHIEHPTPYSAAERDDTEVPLDDPSLTMPVYWLDKRFIADPPLPPLQLIDTESTKRPSLRLPRASLLYATHPNRGHSEGVALSLWPARHWRRLEARGDRLPSSVRCGELVRNLNLPSGHALIFKGVQGKRGRCGTRPRRMYTARLYRGGDVITAQTLSICAVCFGAGTGPYNSLRGMKAVLRGLTLRPQPGYRAP